MLANKFPPNNLLAVLETLTLCNSTSPSNPCTILTSVVINPLLCAIVTCLFLPYGSSTACLIDKSGGVPGGESGNGFLFDIAEATVPGTLIVTLKQTAHVS